MARASLPARALWFTAPRTAELRPESIPPPGEGEVRVLTLCSAISRGTEMLVYRGEVAPELPLDLPTLVGSYAFPIKYGYAAVGRVLDAGPGAEEFSAGDVVFALHPHQSAFIVPAALVVRLPDGLDPVLGTFFANLETALNVVHDTPLRLGETVAVFGQGVVGLLVTQLLRLAGAGCVISVDPFAARRDLSERLGAHHALAPEELPERVTELTGGRGADVAIEASGAPAALGAAVECVAGEGTVVVASWYGSKPASLPLGGRFHRGRVRLRSSQVGSIAPELSARWDRRRRARTVLDLMTRLRLEEMVSCRLPFERAPQAYRMLDVGAEEALQVIFKYGEG
ncbi:MAG: zinc-binding alcohol dehydrogenase [Actinomycetota bacterium]